MRNLARDLRVIAAAAPPSGFVTVDALTLIKAAEELWALARLLVECRDALPAISRASAMLNNIKLDLGDRIDQAIEPWKVPNGTPGAI